MEELFMSLYMACLDMKNAQLFHFPAVVVRAPLSCLVLIGREFNNDRTE